MTLFTLWIIISPAAYIVAGYSAANGKIARPFVLLICTTVVLFAADKQNECAAKRTPFQSVLAGEFQ